MEAIDAAAERRMMRRLSQRYDAPGLRQLSVHLAALGASGGLVLLSREIVWVLIPALVIHGIVLVFLFAPLHETIHRTAFRSARLNALVASVCGFLLVLPPRYFRAFHLAHHRHTQDPALDPELATAKPETFEQWLVHVSGWPYWTSQITVLLTLVRGRAPWGFVRAGARPAMVAEARRFLAGYLILGAASLALTSDLLLWLWVLPALLGQPFLRLYLLAEHGGCPHEADMLRNSRTTRSNALVRRLAWNMPYHAEHHAYPALPFYALPQAHARLADRILVQADGYIQVTREILGRLSRRRGADPA